MPYEHSKKRQRISPNPVPARTTQRSVWLLTLCENAAALGGEHLVIETRHGKEAAEPSTELSDGLMHRRVRWPRRWGLGPSLLSTGTIQLLRAPVQRSTLSAPRHKPRQKLERTRNDGTRLLQNAAATAHKENDPA